MRYVIRLRTESWRLSFCNLLASHVPNGIIDRCEPGLVGDTCTSKPRRSISLQSWHFQTKTSNRKAGFIRLGIILMKCWTRDLSIQIRAQEIHHGKGLEVRLSLALSTVQVTVRFSSAKFPEGTIESDTTYLYNYCMELNGREIFSSLWARDSAHKTFGPTDLTSRYSVCTRRVIGDIGHRTPAFRYGV
ncbi:hypothetical protein TNCV_935851 [Trichonephila clavipes]|nr:hypothetical protein TNCV_935851 [Trichonephila clavipes]